MSEKERLQQILAVLGERPFASVKDLIDVLNVSAATIRRDLDKLHRSGDARKVFGGIASVSRDARASALAFGENSRLATDAKAAIADRAASLCADGDMIMIASGSTCHQLGLRLSRRPITVFTNSMPLAAALGAEGVCQVVVTGGTLYREPGILFDHDGHCPNFYASRLFLGAQGLGPEGVLESHPLLAHSTTQMLDRTDEVIVLADSRKLAVRARHVTCAVARISTVVTDDAIEPDDLARLHDAGVRVLVVGTEQAA